MINAGVFSVNITMEALDSVIGITSPQPTTLKSILYSSIYYPTLPLIYTLRILWKVLAVLLAPIGHLASFFWRSTTYPFSLLYKLEVSVLLVQQKRKD